MNVIVNLPCVLLGILRLFIMYFALFNFAQNESGNNSIISDVTKHQLPLVEDYVLPHPICQTIYDNSYL